MTRNEVELNSEGVYIRFWNQRYLNLSSTHHSDLPENYLILNYGRQSTFSMSDLHLVLVLITSTLQWLGKPANQQVSVAHLWIWKIFRWCVLSWCCCLLLMIMRRRRRHPKRTAHNNVFIDLKSKLNRIDRDDDAPCWSICAGGIRSLLHWETSRVVLWVKNIPNLRLCGGGRYR